MQDSQLLAYPWHELPWNQVVHTPEDPDLVLKLRLPRSEDRMREKHNHKILVWVRENTFQESAPGCCRVRIVSIMHDQADDPNRYFFDEIEIPVVRALFSEGRLVESIASLSRDGELPFELALDFRYFRWRFRLKLDRVIARAIELLS